MIATVNLVLLMIQGFAVASGTVQADAFSCTITRHGEFGEIRYEVHLHADGTPFYREFDWVTPHRELGARFIGRWIDSGALRDAFHGPDWANLEFLTRRRWRGHVRLEVRRTAERSDEFGYAGPFTRMIPWEGRLFAAISRFRWDELAAWTAGAGEMTVALVDRRGTVLARDQVRADMLAPAAAMRAAEEEMAPAVADPTRRCAVMEPTITF